MLRTETSRFTQAARTALAHAPSGPPAGWAGEVEAGLLDAVLSVRATYGRPDTGVRAAVARWRDRCADERLDDLDRLATSTPTMVASVLGNQQRLSGDVPKSAAAVDVAQRLRHLGVRHAADLRAGSLDHRGAVTGVVGLGPLTWDYLLLVLGVPDRLADRRLRAFAERVLGCEVSDDALVVLLEHAAQRLSLTVTALELALWRAQGRRGRPDTRLPSAC